MLVLLQSPPDAPPHEPCLLYVAEIDRIQSELHDVCAETEERLARLLPPPPEMPLAG